MECNPYRLRACLLFLRCDFLDCALRCYDFRGINIAADSDCERCGGYDLAFRRGIDLWVCLWLFA